MKSTKKRTMKNFLATMVAIPIANRVLSDIEWDHRKELLKDKTFFQKFWFYIKHFLGG